MKLILFIILLSFCLGKINLREETYVQVNQDIPNRCQTSCVDQMDQILQGALIGFVSNVNGGTFESFSRTSFLQMCCNQQKTYDFLNGYIVPDFTDVKQTNIEDYNDVQVDINPSQQTGKFEIMIKHTFQRVAFQLNANTQLQANMTKILSYLSEPNKCDYLSTMYSKNWLSIIGSFGEQVFTEVFVGADMIINVNFVTDKQYSKEQIANKYLQLIYKHKLEDIPKFFTNGDYGYGFSKRGGVNLNDCDNFQDYLSKLNPSNYVQIIPLDQQRFQTSEPINSYELFEKESIEVQDCSKEVWNFKYRGEIQSA